MRVGLIDVDGHNYPNLALMKISAFHKSKGDSVEWWWGFGEYDRVYMSKIFDDIYTPDIPEPWNAKEIIKGGTGYDLGNKLPDEIENMYPDYSLYPSLTKDTAYGFLTRGCPNNCPFCIVSSKEGRTSRKVADLRQWWDGQKNIVLMDANILACRDHMDLLEQLVKSGASVDINQGLDARLLTEQNVEVLKRIKINEVHFAWDLMKNSGRILKGLELWKRCGRKDKHGTYGTVYVLTNYNTTMSDNLSRIYTLRDMGYNPYVMVYDKPKAPREIRDLQRWCNNKIIFGACRTFEEYAPRRTGKDE